MISIIQSILNGIKLDITFVLATVFTNVKVTLILLPFDYMIFSNSYEQLGNKSINRKTENCMRLHNKLHYLLILCQQSYIYQINIVLKNTAI